MAAKSKAVAIEPKIERFAHSMVLFDRSLVDAVTPDWFTVEHWASSVTPTAAGRGASWFVADADRELVLRHYCRGGLIARLSRDRYVFMGAARTRSFAEWRLLAVMAAQGLPVPRPLAAHYRRHGLRYSADILLERLDHVSTLAASLTDAGIDWAAVGHCIRRFHDAGIWHADLNAHNILLNQRGGEPVYLIDFDRGRRRDPGRWSEANLERLKRSLRKLSGGQWPEPVAAGWETLTTAYQG